LWGTAAGHAFCCVLVGILGVMTWQQSHDYRDVETLYRATIAKNPECWMALNNLGGMLVARGSRDEGRALVLKAVALRPRYAEAHNNLGIVAFDEGRIDQAIGEFREALDAGLITPRRTVILDSRWRGAGRSTKGSSTT
jgi:Tfp pilus assembly protein PilF